VSLGAARPAVSTASISALSSAPARDAPATTKIVGGQPAKTPPRTRSKDSSAGRNSSAGRRPARKVMPVRVPIALPICCAPFLALSGPGAAEPKGANGETCDSSETNVKHEIKGTQYVCDKCVYSKCDTTGGQISNCQVVTHWSKRRGGWHLRCRCQGHDQWRAISANRYRGEGGQTAEGQCTGESAQ
jgi:hypothetical protein